MHTRLHIRTRLLACQIVQSLKRNIFIILFTVIAIIVGIVIYFSYDPSANNLFPKCPFKALTGYECPGCGSQRAIHSLLHGDLATAFRMNAMLVISIPFLLLVAFAELFKKRFPLLNKTVISTTTGIVVLILIIGWWILRNIIDV